MARASEAPFGSVDGRVRVFQRQSSMLTIGALGVGVFMSRIHIAYIVPTLDQSGAEKQLYLLASGLPKDRYEPHVLAITRGGHYERPLKEAGIPVDVVGKRMKWDPTSLWRLKRRLAELKPDIVHTWLFAGNSYGRAAAIWAKCPRLIASERCVDSWKRKHQFVLDRWLARYTDIVAVNAKAVAEFYERVGIAREKIVVVPNAIAPDTNHASKELPADRKASLDLPDGVPLIGFVGRLWPQKRVQDLIWAADILRIGGFDFRVLIVGDGPRRTALEGLTRSLDLGRMVRFVGHCTDARQLMDLLDILVLPSRFEGMPNVALEAMQAGKPVVATRIAGMDEVVVDGVTGLLVPPKRPMDLARALSRLLGDAELCTSLGSAGKERAADLFSVERMLHKYIDIYSEMMEGSGGRSRSGSDP